ncbi:MAG: IS607 family transposase [Cetobacterium sp.]|uniref:IS607 family transposase n=1 Tax=Cetobacterium sp. TaxID=2071632 RepID=UPI003F3F14DF
MKKYIKPKEASEFLGVSVKTLQRWDKEEKFKAFRSPTGRRYCTKEQLFEYQGLGKNDKKNVIYTRVSTPNQKDDLVNQKSFLLNYCAGKGVIVDEVISDLGSGLNYKRKNWNNLIERCFKGEIDTIYVSHKDRFVRFGFEWFENFVNKFGTKIIIVNNDILSPNEEVVQDIISILHVFSCRIYGLRKYKKALVDEKL